MPHGRAWEVPLALPPSSFGMTFHCSGKRGFVAFPFKSTLKLCQSAQVTPVFEPFLPSGIGSSHQVLSNQLLCSLPHGQIPQNFSSDTNPRAAHWPDGSTCSFSTLFLTTGMLKENTTCTPDSSSNHPKALISSLIALGLLCVITWRTWTWLEELITDNNQRALLGWRSFYWYLLPEPQEGRRFSCWFGLVFILGPLFY